MSKARSTGNLNNSILISDTGAITFVSGSTTLASLSTTGQLSGSAPVVFAATSSFANSFTVAGTLTAQTLVVQTITSSVSQITGSTSFGTLSSNTHKFTGSVSMTGSLKTSNSIGVNVATLRNWDSTLMPIEIGTTGNFYAGFNGGSANVIYLGTNAYYNSGWKIANTNASYRPQLLDIGNGNWNFQNTATGTADAAITWTSQMYISSSGAVGIGSTTSLSRPLTIYGSSSTFRGISFRGPSTGDGGNILLEGYDTDDNEYSNLEFVANSGNGYFVFNSATGTNPGTGWTTNARMVIGSNGRVGIGTTSPGRPLEINYAGPGLRLRYNANNYMDFESDFMNQVSSGPNSWQFQFNGSSLMQISSNNAVTIGSTSSAWYTANRCTFEVGGPGFTNSLIGLKINTTTGGYFYHNGTDLYLNNDQGGRFYCIANNGGVYLTSGATSWTANSDERLKNITGNIENAIDSLLTLRTVKHTWKSDNTNKEHLALIAQDVEQVFPQVVDKGQLPNSPSRPHKDETEYLGVRYQELVPVLVKAIQELKAENDTLKEILQRNNIQ